MIENGFQHM